MSLLALRLLDLKHRHQLAAEIGLHSLQARLWAELRAVASRLIQGGGL